MKIYVIAGMHGDERFGLKILGNLGINNKDLCLRVGHPEAVAKNKRYVSTDLNRSFRSADKTKEALMADAIEEELLHFNPDYVIDIHTSITPVGKAGIIAEHNDTTEMLAHALGVENIVVMHKKYTKNALIGCLPDRSISLEFGRGLRSDGLAKEVAERITKLSKTAPDVRHSLPLFRVTATIPKDYERLGSVVNLRFNAGLGAYPFLASEKSYPNMGGFLAKKVN
jgi:succinylglutamate desuccinylase